MKQVLLLVIYVVVILMSCSSSTEFDIKESEVPPNVLSAFKAKYPSAQNVEWEAEKENGKFYFEADFKDGDKEKEVHITSDGIITEED